MTPYRFLVRLRDGSEPKEKAIKRQKHVKAQAKLLDIPVASYMRMLIDRDMDTI